MAIEDIIDINSAKERFMGNYGLFSRFLFRFPGESHYEELEQHIADGDAKAAFETAHAIKGVIGNLSLRRMEPHLFEVVEVLRRGDLPSVEQMKALAESYRETVDAIAGLQAEGTKLF